MIGFFTILFFTSSLFFTSPLAHFIFVQALEKCSLPRSSHYLYDTNAIIFEFCEPLALYEGKILSSECVLKVFQKISLNLLRLRKQS